MVPEGALTFPDDLSCLPCVGAESMRRQQADMATTSSRPRRTAVGGELHGPTDRGAMGHATGKVREIPRSRPLSGEASRLWLELTVTVDHSIGSRQIAKGALISGHCHFRHDSSGGWWWVVVEPGGGAWRPPNRSRTGRAPRLWRHQVGCGLGHAALQRTSEYSVCALVPA